MLLNQLLTISDAGLIILVASPSCRYLIPMYRRWMLFQQRKLSCGPHTQALV